MAGKHFRQALLAGVVLLTAGPVAAAPVGWEESGKPWLSQQSEHFSVHFVDGHQQSAARVLDIAERVHREMVPFFPIRAGSPYRGGSG